jgi:hypothetical protein
MTGSPNLSQAATTWLSRHPGQVDGFLVPGGQIGVQRHRHLRTATRTGKKADGAAGPRDAGGPGLQGSATAEAGRAGSESSGEFGQAG